MNTLIVGSGSRSVERLHAPSGLILDFVANGQEIDVVWEPLGRPQREVEVRIQPVSVFPSGLAATYIPIWNVQFLFGHGEANWTIPRPINEPLNPSRPYTLPARGMVARLDARDLRCRITQFGSVPFGGVGALETSKVQVSIQPCAGMKRPQTPTAQFVDSTAIFAFPPDATEWRIREVTGLPFAVAFSVSLFGPAATIGAIIPSSNWDDWQPIPHDATLYQFALAAGVFAVAHFR